MQKRLIIFMPSIEGGGVEKNLFIISNYLSRKISNVSIITSSYIFKEKFNKEILLINPKYKFWNFMNRRSKYFICLILLFKEILKNRNTLVFAFQANLYCIILCKFLNIKIITRSNSSPSGWSKNFIKKFLYKILLKNADQVIVNSKEFKAQMEKFFSLKVKCIYNPLDKKNIIFLSKQKIDLKFYNYNKKKNINILNIGRFVNQKDHMTLLKAIKIIKNKINFKMLIIGRGTNKKKMINFIKEHDLSKEVKIIPFQRNPYKFIKLCNLFILSSAFEGLPNVLLEAICLRKFVISSKCPTGPNEILNGGKGGFLFKVGDFEELAKKIEEFYYNRKICKKRIEYAYKNLYRFDYNNNLKKYLNVVLTHLKY